MSRSLLSREKRWWSTWQGTESRKRCTNRATRVGSPQYNPCKPTRHLKRQKKVQNVQFDKWPGLLHILHSVWKSPKMSHLGFDRNLQLAKLTICIFSIFNELLSTQNVNVARSDVERDFFCDFQTPWLFSEYKVQWSNSLWCYSSCNGHIELLVLEAIKYHVFQNVVLNTLIDK